MVGLAKVDNASDIAKPVSIAVQDALNNTMSIILSMKAQSKGEKGDKGEVGLQGLQGIQGDKGDVGLEGLQGIKGDKGEVGLQGIKGDKGDVGLQGIKGDKGDIGLQGLQGIQGAKGDRGDPGGPTGPKGEKGDSGLTPGTQWGSHLFWNGSSWAIGDSKITLGSGAGQNSQGTNSVALGSNAGNQNLGKNSIAIGANTVNKFENAVALGVGASTTANNQIVLGTSSETVVIPGTVSCSLITDLQDQITQLKSIVSPIFVAVGKYSGDNSLKSQIIVSKDGMNWTPASTPSPFGRNGFGRDVVWNGKIFVAVGHCEEIGWSAINVSKDGMNWIPAKTWGGVAFPQVVSGESVDWNGKIFVAGINGYGGILTSSDGFNWSFAINNPFGGNGACRSVDWNGKIFVAVGNLSRANSLDCQILTSVDGLTWSPIISVKRDGNLVQHPTILFGEGGTGTGVVWTGQMFVVVAVVWGNFWQGQTAISNDGYNWVVANAYFGGYNHSIGWNGGGYGIAWNGKILVAVGVKSDGGLGQVLTSSNGIDWVASTTPYPFGENGAGMGVVWSKDKFVAVGLNGQITTSVDGMTWIQSTTPAPFGTTGVGYGICSQWMSS